jgi:hypothetical protein
MMLLWDYFSGLIIVTVGFLAFAYFFSFLFFFWLYSGFTRGMEVDIKMKGLR